MWRVGAEGEWHLWFSAFQGKTTSDFMHLGARSDCNDCHSKKKKNPSRFWPHGKCVTDELLGRMTQKKMAFKNKTAVSHFVKFIVHGVGEIHCSLASRSAEPRDGRERHDELQIELSNLFPATNLNPYSEPYFPGNHQLYITILLWN